MTDETKTIPENTTDTTTVSESVPLSTSAEENKSSDVGKKITGFLGGLAEKAKNLDVKDLAEKAKNIDVKDLSEKAKQKVSEVKDKATEISAGKTDGTIPLREQILPDQMKELLAKASAAMLDDMPNVAKAQLVDASMGESVPVKVGFGENYIAVSDKCLYHLQKASNQYCVFTYNIKAVMGISVLPPRAENAGILSIILKNNEIKLKLNSIDAYAKAILLSKKIKDIAFVS